MAATFAGDCIAQRSKPGELVYVYGGYFGAAGITAVNFIMVMLGLVIIFMLLPDMPNVLKMLLGFPLAVGVSALISVFRHSDHGWWSTQSEGDMSDGTLRGATLAGKDDLIAVRKKQQRNDDETMVLANIPINIESEMRHAKILGTTGTGKSTIIRQIIDIARRRGDRMIIADPDGGYLAAFYDPDRDHVLCPFDGRSALWDLFAEIKTPYDSRMVAESLIPLGRSGDEWPEYARTFVAALLSVCKKKGLSIADFWNLAMCAPQEVLHELLAGTQAEPYTEKNNARMLGSIRSVAGTSLAALEHVKDAKGEAMGVRDWMRKGTGTLFIPYQASQISSLRNLVSAWMRLGITELMEMPEQDNRVWFVIDELDAIGRIDGLKDALARLRKFGGRVVLGFQSLSQILATYGEEDAATIMENCTNTVVLRCSASAGGGTSAFASQLIGEREITQTNSSKDADGRTSTSTSVVKNSLILPSEIERLPDLEGFTKIAEHPAWFRTKLEPYQLPQKAERFVPRSFD
jgi:hypothetical protein